ncbi:hypothetical protein ACP70R_011624 [Stipagrostis hirtigluma subsp. patula]
MSGNCGEASVKASAAAAEEEPELVVTDPNVAHQITALCHNLLHSGERHVHL